MCSIQTTDNINGVIPCIYKKISVFNSPTGQTHVSCLIYEKQIEQYRRNKRVRIFSDHLFWVWTLVRFFTNDERNRLVEGDGFDSKVRRGAWQFENPVVGEWAWGILLSSWLPSTVKNMMCLTNEGLKEILSVIRPMSFNSSIVIFTIFFKK